MFLGYWIAPKQPASVRARTSVKKTRGWAGLAVAELLESRRLLAAVEPVITEFMAQNNSTIKDEDGDFSDWLEIYNPNPAPFNLNGYFLANKPTKLNKWKFPNVSLAGHGYMIVWASNKNRIDPTKPLHTNFALSKDGDYLALVKPDGATIDEDFGALFPPQNPDVSYGIPLTDTALVGSTDNVKYLIPQSGSVDSTWTASNFDDSNWNTGENGVGYDTTGVLSSAINTNVQSAMQNKETSAYMRVTFNVADPAQFDALTLSMRYNDGFIAYLNGQQIARKNAPSTTQWNSTANATGPDGAPSQDFDVSSFLSALQPGTNVLAIDGLNESKGDADFYMSPQLIGINARVGTPTFLAPTPGAINNANSVEFVSDTKFDHDRGFYSSPFDLAISTDTADATIRYTTDGSAPSTTAGTIYTGPIHISTTTVVRALAYETGMTPTNVDAQTYIFPNDVIHQPASIPGYPTPQEPVNDTGTSVPFDFQMDPSIVNNPAYSTAVINGLESIPTLSVATSSSTIFGPNGFYDTGTNTNDVEVPISFEYIDPAHPQDTIQINAGISGHSKQRLKRSFDVHFRSEYGASKLDDGIFQDAPLGGSTATSEIDQLILRAGNNRSWATTSAPALTTYTEDEWVRENQIAVSGVGVHGTFVQLYINGLYLGLYNIVERPDAGYGAAYYSGSKDNWFAISQDGVQDGDATRWNFMMNTLAAEDLSISANYAQMQQYLDVKEFADYIISEWYAGKSDWPTNNYWAGGDTSTKMPFQFYSWDGEDMMNTVFLPVNPPSTPPNGAWVNPYFLTGNTDVNVPIVKLWRALRNSPDFMTLFADRAYKALENDGALTDANALARWDTLNNFIKDAVVDESARWGDSLASTGRPTRTRDGDWTSSVQAIRNDIQGNAEQLIDAMRAAGFYPSIDPATMNQQGGLVPSGFNLSLTNPNSGGTVY
ncbi:MAG TPA: CotH kinase family protein, partial [Tepidisphaeraceae bacterium]|nr:CotH kinase family protein [Tepidisphaeraceae bacterium]